MRSVRWPSLFVAGALCVPGAAIGLVAVPQAGAAGPVASGHHDGAAGGRAPGTSGGRRMSTPTLHAPAYTTATGEPVVGTYGFAGTAEIGTDVTSLGGTWTVPTVTAASSETVALTGIDAAQGATTALALGTSESTTAGAVRERAFYELSPATEVYLTTAATPGGAASDTVAPGDVVQASVSSAGTTRWTITIHDTTAGWTFTTTVDYAMTANSVAWGTARTYVNTGGTLKALPLADYGSTTFSHLTMAEGGGTPAPAPMATATAVYMFDTAGNVATVATTVISAATESFTDRYVAVPARIFGTTADGTAAQELEHQFPAGHCPGTTGTRAVVLATDKTYADALASAYLASSLGTGTLLTSPTSLSQTTLDALKMEGITRIDIVGGPLAITTGVADQLKSTPAYACGGASTLGKNLTVQRIFGPTAYDTARDIATTPSKTDVGSVDLAGAYGYQNAQHGLGLYNQTSGTASSAAASTIPMPTAVLATGKTFQDAESASTLAYAQHLPILLTTSSTLSPQVTTAISKLGIAQVIVMGGPLAVSDTVVRALVADNVSVLRIAGSDATQTATELATCELGPATGHVGLNWPATGGVTVARGNGFTDGLAGAVVAADGPGSASPEPLLLTESPTTPGTNLLGFLAEAGTSGIDGKKMTHLTILGGLYAISQQAANQMAVALAF